MRTRLVTCLFLSAIFVFIPRLHASSILVRSQVPGASLKLDRQERGITDENGKAVLKDISPGRHRLIISKDGYRTYSEDVLVKEGLTIIVEVTLALIDKTPPEIRLLTPEPVRGIRVEARKRSIQVSGLARDESGVDSVYINGINAALTIPNNQEIKLLPGNTVKFNSKVTLVEGANTILIEAVDKAGNRAKLEQPVFQKDELLASLEIACHALLVGVNDYKHWKDLNNPATDIQELAEELDRFYGFKTKVLRNSTKREIETDIRRYLDQKFSENDELLIVLAGHGYFDEKSKIGYFVGSDGKRPNEDPTFESYIAYPILQRIINNIPCKHILLVLDACFAGTFTEEIALRGLEDYQGPDRKERILRKMELRSRRILTSGGNEYVPDGRPGHNSPFMHKFLEGIRSYGGSDGILTLEELYANYIDNVDPRPIMDEFPDNQAGSTFLFISR